MRRDQPPRVSPKDAKLSPLGRAVLAMVAVGASVAVAPRSAFAQAAPEVKPAETSATLQTVTITSVRKKLESVQDVPATVNVLSGADLAAAGVTDVRGIEYKIPGLMLGDKGFDGASIGLRGASSIRGFTGDEAAVAVHLDGIYIPQSGAALGRLFDVNRVDTLYGPQGTLYGRNAVAGVIDIVSNAPRSQFGGSAQISQGSFKTTAAEGVLNVPLSESGGLRFAVSGAKGDGYVRNVLDGRTFGNDDFLAGRVRYVGRLGDSVRSDITFQTSRDKSTPALQPARLNDPGSLTQGVGWRQTAVDVPVSNDREDTNLAVKFDIELGNLVLRSITGYSYYSAKYRNDTERSISATPIGASSVDQDSKALSQEFNLMSSGNDFLDWRIGAYFSSTKVNESRSQDDTNSTFATIFGGYDSFLLTQKGEAAAVFGSADWMLSKALTLTTGLRYNTETKEQSQNQTWGNTTPVGVVPVCSATGGGANFCRSADTQKYRWSGTSGDVSLKWQLNRETMLFTRAARGFRSGAVGGVIALDNGLDQLFFGPGNFTLVKLKPEVLDSYEVGVKNTLMGGKLLLNASAYYNVYKDQLVFTSDPVTFRLIEGNAGKSKYKGVDLNGAWVPNDAWRFDGSLSYVDAEITDVGSISAGAAVGNKPILSPRTSASIAVSYRMPVAGGRLTINGEANHKSLVYFDLANKSSQPAVELFNLNLGWEAPGARWRVFASVNNVFDKEYLSNTARTDAAAGAGPLASTVGAPRTFRVGAGFTF